MNEQENPDKLYSIGEMATLGLIKNRLNGGAIKNRQNLGRLLKGHDLTVVPTKYGPAKCWSMEQINAYNAGVTPRYASKSKGKSEEV